MEAVIPRTRDAPYPWLMACEANMELECSRKESIHAHTGTQQQTSPRVDQRALTEWWKHVLQCDGMQRRKDENSKIGSDSGS